MAFQKIASLSLFSRKIPGFLSLASGVSLVFAGSVQASMSQDEYFAALKIAEKKVQRTQAMRTASANALSSSLLRSLFGRYYQVGDQWDVAAWRFDNPMSRKIGEGDLLKTKAVQGGIFRYEVVQVKNGANPQVNLKVTQLTEQGMVPVDPRVERLSLTMNDKLMQSDKTYYFKGRAEGVKVSADGLRSGVTTLELFPLDVPEVSTAEKETATAMPELPENVRSVAEKAGYKPDLGRSLWFEQDDFFGRPIQILWQQGDPWPAYFKTTGGVAILLRKVTS